MKWSSIGGGRPRWGGGNSGNPRGFEEARVTPVGMTWTTGSQDLRYAGEKAGKFAGIHRCIC